MKNSENLNMANQKPTVRRTGYATKKERITLHKYVILSYMIMTTLDEMDIEVPEFKAALEKAEAILDGVTDPKENPLETTMYIEEIAQKIETIMRKNYKPV